MSLKRKAVDLSAGGSAKKAKSITDFFGAPNVVPKPEGLKAAESDGKAADTDTTTEAAAAGGTAPASKSGTMTVASVLMPAKFDKEAWVGKLSDEQRQLLQLEIQTLDDSWLLHLKDTITSKPFLDLKRFLKSEEEAKQKIFPPPEDVYSW